MTQTAAAYPQAGNLAALTIAVQALLDTGYHTVGPAVWDGTRWTQSMANGNGSDATFEGLSTRVDALETDDTADDAAIAAISALDTATAYVADGAIAIDKKSVALTKASAGAYTLAAPDATSKPVDIVSNTAFAHVLTFTGDTLADGVAGSPHTTATFAAFKGASLRLVPYNGLWHLVSINGVVIT